MKTQAKTTIKKAATSTAAIRNKQHKTFYRTLPVTSSLKLQIGQLLFLLLAGDKQSDDWRQFEQLLRQFYDGGFCER